MFNHFSKPLVTTEGFPTLSVNEATDPSLVPPCDIGHVFDRLLQAAYALRLKYPQDSLLACKIDVADAFRQLLMHPAFARFFTYVWGDWLVLDLRLTFGWLGSPGFFYQWALKLQQFVKAKRPSDISEEVVKTLGELALKQKIEKAGRFDIRPIPADPIVREQIGIEEEPDSFFNVMETFIDDSIVLVRNIGDRPKKLGQALLWAHFVLWGYPREGYPGPVKAAKFSDFESVLEILGVQWDLNQMTLSLPPDKAVALHKLLTEEWPQSRRQATPRQVLSLCGKLRSISQCVRLGRYFLRRILDNLIGRWGRQDLDKKIWLDQGLHQDLDMWRWIINLPRLVQADFSTPIYNHVKRRADFLAMSDACGTAGGGFVAPLGIWYKVEWPDLAQRHFQLTVDPQSSPPAGHVVTIAHLELAALVLNLGIMVEESKERGQPLEGKVVQALADSSNAIFWAIKAGARDKRANRLIQLFGLLEAGKGTQHSRSTSMARTT